MASNNILKSALLTWGFKNSSLDNFLFIYRQQNTILLLLVYVDDVILTGNNPSLLKNLIVVLGQKFALKDLGPLNFFLGIEVTRTPSGLILSQSKYIDDLLKRLNLTSLKLAPTPLVLGKHYSTSGDTPMANPYIYRNIVGAL